MTDTVTLPINELRSDDRIKLVDGDRTTTLIVEVVGQRVIVLMPARDGKGVERVDLLGTYIPTRDPWQNGVLMSRPATLVCMFGHAENMPLGLPYQEISVRRDGERIL